MSEEIRKWDTKRLLPELLPAWRSEAGFERRAVQARRDYTPKKQWLTDPGTWSIPNILAVRRPGTPGRGSPSRLWSCSGRGKAASEAKGVFGQKQSSIVQISTEADCLATGRENRTLAADPLNRDGRLHIWSHLFVRITVKQADSSKSGQLKEGYGMAPVPA